MQPPSTAAKYSLTMAHLPDSVSFRSEYSAVLVTLTISNNDHVGGDFSIVQTTGSLRKKEAMSSKGISKTKTPIRNELETYKLFYNAIPDAI